MTLPASGAISLGAVNTELGVSATATRSLNDSTTRTLFGVPSGAIALSNGYGKANKALFTLTSADLGSGTYGFIEQFALGAISPSALLGFSVQQLRMVNAGMGAYELYFGVYAASDPGAFYSALELNGDSYPYTPGWYTSGSGIYYKIYSFYGTLLTTGTYSGALVP